MTEIDGKKQKLLEPNDPMPNELQEEISRKGIKECIGKLKVEKELEHVFL